MYDLAKKAREKMKAKARSLAGERDTKVDSSDWTPAEPLNAEAKTGARPISKRQFKKGGKVVGKAAGAASAPRADRKPRKAGGRVESAKSEKNEAKAIANAKVNRNVREANEEREGVKHVGGFKSGGKAKRATGGGVKDKQALGGIDPTPKRGAAQHYKKGGKVKKADGGSFLQRTIGGGEKEKREREIRDVGKGQTSNYSQEDKGALNRMLNENDALPEAGEIIGRSGKFQNYKKGGRTKKAEGGESIGSKIARGLNKLTGYESEADKQTRQLRDVGKGTTSSYSGEDKARMAERLRGEEPTGSAEEAMQASGRSGYKKGGQKWIQGAIEKPGALRKSLGVKKGEKIPAKKLAAAAEKGGKLGKRARLAETLGRGPVGLQLGHVCSFTFM
mgnify:FL=1